MDSRDNASLKRDNIINSVAHSSYAAALILTNLSMLAPIVYPAILAPALLVLAISKGGAALSGARHKRRHARLERRISKGKTITPKQMEKFEEEKRLDALFERYQKEVGTAARPHARICGDISFPSINAITGEVRATEDFMRKTSREDMDAAVSHEFGHFALGLTRSVVIKTLYSSAMISGAVAAIASMGTPSQLLLRLSFVGAGLLLNQSFKRREELLADAYSVYLGNTPEAVGNFLSKSHQESINKGEKSPRLNLLASHPSTHVRIEKMNQRIRRMGSPSSSPN